MCHQSVGLIEAAREEAGIATVGVSVAREITERVGPPRTLQVPYAFGYPLGRPGDAGLQTAIIRRACALLASPGPPPVVSSFE